MRGGLTNSDRWRVEYGLNRYMERATKADIELRSQDIMANLVGVNDDGKITPDLFRPGGRIDPRRFEYWTSRQTHIFEEIALRRHDMREYKLADPEQMPWLQSPLGPPRGLQILKDTKLPLKPYLAKIGKREHILPMYTDGRIRIAPASLYGDPSLNSAIHDDELSVTGVSSGKHTRVQVVDPATGTLGEPFPILGEFRRGVQFNSNFHVACFAERYSPRLLDDFGGDALLIVTDVAAFTRRLRRAVAKQLAGALFEEGPTTYYDPYFLGGGDAWVPMMKHFRYSYQNEYRMIWLGEPDGSRKLDPVFVSIGSLRGLARYYALPA